MDLISTLREFVVENFLFGDDSQLEEDSSFLESGIIDSTGILELIQFLEETYDIKIEDEELIPENFSNLIAIDHYLDLKLNGNNAS